MSTKDPLPRQAWLSLLAKAPAARLAQLLPDLPEHRFLRAPQIGAVMVCGRVGALGAAFHLGEMTVTRCAVRLGAGAVGHGYVQGRDMHHATRVAVIDALMQGDQASDIERKILSPLRADADLRRSVLAAQAAATKVEFFTMVRGED